MAASSQSTGSDPRAPEPEPDAGSPIPVDSPSKRIPALDGLRGIAILLVLLYHTVFQLQPDSRLLSSLLRIGRLTWSGVDLFFVLSGFLIGGILLDARDSPRYFKTFYLRRAYRILPLYGVVLGLFSLRFLLEGSAGPLGNFSSSPIPWVAYLTFTQNFWMAYLGSFGAGAMVVTWSLAVEEQFYLTVPWLIRKAKQAHLAYVLLAVVVAAPLMRIALHFFFRNGNFAAYVLMPCRADALSLGILSALAVRTPRALDLLQAKRSVLCWGTGLLFLGLAPLSYWGYEFSTVMVTGGYSWLAFFYTGCLLIAVTRASVPVERLLRSRMLTQLGVLAYCTYLLHVPLIEASRRLLGLTFAYASAATQLWGGVIGVLVTLVIANISWAYFEKPLLQRGHMHKY